MSVLHLNASINGIQSYNQHTQHCMIDDTYIQCMMMMQVCMYSVHMHMHLVFKGLMKCLQWPLVARDSVHAGLGTRLVAWMGEARGIIQYCKNANVHVMSNS